MSKSKNTRNTMILITVLITLIGFYFLFVYDSGGSSYEQEATAFSLEDTSVVKKIVMTKVVKDEEQAKITLEKVGPDFWKVNGKYVADLHNVKRLLVTASHLGIKEPLKDKGKQTALELLKKNHTEVTYFNTKGEEIKSYYIGTTNKEQTGNIMLMKGYEDAFIVSREGMLGYISIYFSTNEEEWRENLLWDVPASELDHFGVEYRAAPDAGFHLKYSEGGWQLNGGQPDSVALNQFLGQFRGKVFAESFAGKGYPGVKDSLKAKQPDFTVTAQRAGMPARVIRFWGREDNQNNLFAIIDGNDELLTVQHFVIDPFLKTRDYFIHHPL